MYIFFCGTNQKNVLQKEIKDLTFEVSNLSIIFFFFFKLFPMRDKTFMTPTQKGGEEVLKFVTCLWILLVLNNRSIVHFRKWGVGQKISHFLLT